MRLVKIGGQHFNPDRVAFVNTYSDSQANVWFSGLDGDRTVVRGTPAEVAALLSAEPAPVPIIYVCRDCGRVEPREPGRCACGYRVVACHGLDGADALEELLEDVRAETLAAISNERAYGGGE